MMLASPNVSFLLVIVVMFGLMYLVMIRPQVKKAKAAQAERDAMVAALGPGSRVLLTSGVFGTIRHLGERQAVIELAPGVEITVMKQAITKAVTPDEEDFEYEDESAPVESTTVQPSDEQATDQRDAFGPTAEQASPTDLDDLPEPTVPGTDAPKPGITPQA